MAKMTKTPPEFGEDERFDTHLAVKTITPEEVLAVARRFFPQIESTSITQLVGGYSNANYLLSAEAKKVVLRIYSSGPRVGKREVSVLERLKKENIAAPAVLDYSEVDTSAACIMEYIDGVLLSKLLRDKNTDREDLFYKIGEELARIHRVEFSQPGLFDQTGEAQKDCYDFSHPFPAFLVEALNGRAGERMGAELKEKTAGFFEAHWPVVKENHRVHSLVHCDFNPKNIIIANGSPVVLDWEFAMSGPSIIDFGNFFRFESDYLADDRDELIEGYESIAPPLPETWRFASKLLDLMAVCDFLDRDADYPKTFRTAIAIIKQTV